MRSISLIIFLITFFAFMQSVDAQTISVANQSENRNLWIVFNQPEYAPGDTAYFTGYYHSMEKQIVSIKLFGPAKELIYHARVLFQHGAGRGQIIIPQNYEPGSYQYVCYSESKTMEDSPFYYFGHLAISSNNHFNTRSIQIQEDTTNIIIATDKEKYQRRSRVILSISPQDLPKSSTLVSIAVYNEQLFHHDTNQHLTSISVAAGMKLNSDKIKVTSKFPGFPDYFTGRAINNSNGQAVSDSTKITFYLSNDDFAYETYTKNGGYFSFPLFKNYRDESIYYRISYKGVRLMDCKIIMDDVSINDELLTTWRSDTMNTYGIYAFQKQFINKSFHYFNREIKVNSINNFVSDVEADKEVLLDKFEPFVSMAEVISNVVPSVRYKKSGNDERIRIFLERTAELGESDPIYIVDGIMTDDTRYILNLDPKVVRKIGVLFSKDVLVRFGDLGLDGMLVIETNILDHSQLSSANRLSVVGIGSEMEYKKVAYRENNNSRLPDLRSSLYWNPNAEITKANTFDFYTSDDIGYYIIQIVGVVNGQRFYSTKRFYVSSDLD